MDNSLFGIPDLDRYVVISILVFFGLMEVIAGYLHRTQRSKSDWIQEVGSFFVLSVLIKPAIVIAAIALGQLLFPTYEYALGHWSLLLMLPFYLFIDDVLQYWYHRSAHEYEFLWKLHRPHHQAEEMGFFVSYRNAGLYYVIMPNLWWVGTIVFLGGAKAVALGLILKQLVIIGSHSTIKWDAPLYKSDLLRPLVRLIERILVTPAFHHAHHGKSMLDGSSDPNGNYGNMFSLWDQFFGTAKFVQTYPTDYGLPNDPKDKWTASYFYPIIKSDKPHSEIAAGHIKKDTTVPAAAEVALIKGQQYLYCQCGKSNTQPFCDGSHHGTKFKPLLFEANRTGKAKLCQCKLAKTAPFCDNSHVQLLKDA
ncbi:MAG: sterol desaturase family protein [Saprospiraceae bacterium]